MKTIFKAAAIASLTLAGSVSLPSMAQAQAAQAAILVVDMDRIGTESAAGRNAQTQLKSKLDSVQARAKTLGDQFRNEAETLQKARASMAQEAFQAKVKDLQSRQVTAENELRGREQDYGRSLAYVRKQIFDNVNPIITQLMRERNAQLVISQDATLAIAASIDVTNEVISRLNAKLPSVSITPPAEPAKK